MNYKSKPFIIAEIGSNWKTFEEAKESIAIAKKCGADAVKFQLYTPEALYGFGSSEYTINLNRLSMLHEEAKAHDIEFMCTAFSPRMVDIVDAIVNIHKIASSDLAYEQLLERVKSKGKPILLSTGASSKFDLMNAMAVLKGADVTLLYCVASYPSRMFNLFHMQNLKEMFNVDVGLSDHSLDVFYPALSAYRHFGATVIEKHVNFTKHTDTPDAPHSLNAEEFKYMCEILKGLKDYEKFSSQPEEHDMFMRHNRRLIAVQDIKIGDKFDFGVNYGAYRSLKDDDRGLNPFAWKVVEKSDGAKVDIKAGDSIKIGDF